MKVIVQTAAVQEALALASSIVAIRTPKPVLQCAKLVAGAKKLTLLATDLEAACRCEIAQVEVQKEGEALVPVQKFADIVREAAGEDTLTLSADKDSCEIHTSAARFKLLTYDPGEFPQVSEFADDGDFQVASNALATLSERTLFAAAKAHSHYAISGVLWEAAGKKLQFVATDGHRLAVAKTTLGKAAARDVTAIVPAKMMALLQRASAGSEEALAVKVTDTQLLVRTARAVLMSTLVSGNFPKYNDVIPRDCTRKVAINTQAFGHRLRQAALLTNEQSKGVRLSFAGDQLTLTSRAPDQGEAEVKLPVKFTGEPLEIGFNPVFLIDALRVLPLEEVNMEFTTGNKPAVLKGGGDFLYVVMPVDLA